MENTVSHSKFRILIVDDNVFSIQAYLTSLFEKFHLSEENLNNFKEEISKFSTSLNNVEIDCVNVNNETCFASFNINKETQLWVYFYDALISPELNQAEIENIIIEKNINVFWTDRGHSLLIKMGDKLFGSDEGFHTNSDVFFEDKIEIINNEGKREESNIKSPIVQALIKNNVLQLAIFTFNPVMSQREINQLKKRLHHSFTDKDKSFLLEKENIYFIESSFILTLFSSEDYLASGKEDNNFHGTIEAYQKYGQLLGNVFFDLFLGLEGSLEKRNPRYNFFKKENRSFLRFSKVLHQNKFIYKDFKIGLVSFSSNAFGGNQFLIDFPYKEYYSTYDSILEKNEITKDLFDLDNSKPNEESERWLYCYYNKIEENESGSFLKFYHKEHNELKIKTKIADYVPLLHTAIFYEPDFYAVNKQELIIKGESVDINNLPDNSDGKACEIYYLFKKVDFDGIIGVVHFALWRRKNRPSSLVDIRQKIEGIW